MKKIRCIHANDFEIRLTFIIAFSLIPWFIGMVAIPSITKSSIILPNLIAPLSIIISGTIGFIGETFFTKKYKLKEKLRKFSNAKNQKEMLEEMIEYEIEIEKIKKSNKVLKKAKEKLELKQNLLNTLSNEYDITEKEINSKVIDLKGMEKSLKEKQEELDKKQQGNF